MAKPKSPAPRTTISKEAARAVAMSTGNRPPKRSRGLSAPDARHAVVRVGEGRGFIVEAKHRLGPRRYVITAAHCLPSFPPAMAIPGIEERTYARLLGPLGDVDPQVWAECLFADPIGDVAVLGCPDGQALPDEAEAYDMLTETTPALPIGEAPQKGRARLLTLGRRWRQCVVKHYGGPLWIEDAAQPIVGGMSGSPILANDGWAIGMVCVSRGVAGAPSVSDGPNPRLTDSLPGWLLRTLA